MLSLAGTIQESRADILQMFHITPSLAGKLGNKLKDNISVFVLQEKSALIYSFLFVLDKIYSSTVNPPEKDFLLEK